MDWDKAKNLTIIFLVLLNIFLGALSYWDRNRYVITAEQEKAIVNVLSQNKINMYTRIRKDYKPMKALEMGEYLYDDSSFPRNFFDGGEEPEAIVDSNKMVFSRDEAVLTLQDGYVYYQNPRGMGKKSGDESEAAICANWIKKLNAGRFQLELAVNEQDGVRLKYQNVYNGYVIQTNYIEFFVTENGIEEISMMYSTPKGFQGKTRDICSADEALFTFMRQIKNVYGDIDIFISKIDLVYCAEYTETAGDMEAQPCYRIFVEGQELPFLINGYSNEML